MASRYFLMVVLLEVTHCAGELSEDLTADHVNVALAIAAAGDTPTAKMRQSSTAWLARSSMVFFMTRRESPHREEP